MPPTLRLVPMPGDIEIEPTPCSTIYRGTRQALIEAGVATDDMFPTPPKRNKDNRPQPSPGAEWSVQYRGQGRYQVVRMHEPRPAVRAVAPSELRAVASRIVESLLGMLLTQARGTRRGLAPEIKQPTHRMADADLEALEALGDQLRARIARAEWVPKRAAIPRVGA